MNKDDKKGIIVSAIGITTVLTAVVLLGIFVCKWDVSYEEYADVDYDWDDDRDRYDVFIDGIGRLTIPTDKATVVYLPTDHTKNIAVVRKEQTIFGKLTSYDLKSFYINVGLAKEEKE